jgi:starch synthase
MITRLVAQKGMDLVAEAFDRIVELGAQVVLLGTGDPDLEEALTAAALRFPGRAAVRVDFSNSMAHRIEAGADLFLMPSRFEPCGLSQIYSLRYGTVPVVRRTGGLADTVVDATPETVARREATGFVFDEPDADAMIEALDRACRAFADRGGWRLLQVAGMEQDWSWTRSAARTIALYERMREDT